MDFEVVVDCQLIDLIGTGHVSPDKNKRVLSIINDFEDGLWRGEKFNNFIWDNIVETALSYKERQVLSGRHLSVLKESAKKLRLSDGGDDIGRGSELAEIVLYGIMKNHYKALPVVPKIFYKQNSQDNAKGADSVHIIVAKDDKFTLWFGEAKFYNSIEDARLASIIESVQNSLATDKLKKENSIVINVSDLNHFDEISQKLKQDITAALSSRASIDDIKPLLNIPILLLHECDLTANAVEATDEYRQKIKAHHADRARAYFAKQVKALKSIYGYADICFHLILFPVPKKQPIIDLFVKTAAFHKG